MFSIANPGPIFVTADGGAEDGSVQSVDVREIDPEATARSAR